MAYATADTPEIGGMDEAVLAPRHLVAPAVLGALTRRSDLRGALQLTAHGLCMCATGAMVWAAEPFWYLLVPAMAIHGVTIVTLFAPMHECVHRTAFASRTANAIVGWIAGVLSFYNSTYYWHFHSWHHRYTQDPQRDPELMFPKATNRHEYLWEISGFSFWLRRAIDYPVLACGRARDLPFVPESARRGIALSMSAQLLIYIAGAVSIALGFRGVLFFWFLPAFLAQPFLRGLLIAEHTGCSQERNGLTNTRTTLTWFPIRLLMWNMPYHAEHHLFPAIPFHRLPALHREVRDRLRHVAPGYVAANREIIEGL
jgi:fatty acid desaturase